MSNIMITEEFTKKIFNNELDIEYAASGPFREYKSSFYDMKKKKYVEINRPYIVFVSEKYPSTIKENLTLFDKAVYNAVCSLWEDEENCFTLEQLYRRLTGNPNIQISNYKSAIVYNLQHSLDKICARSLYINLYDEITIGKKLSKKNLNIENDDKRENYIGMYGRLLSLEKRERTNRRTRVSYTITEAPVLYQYAKNKHQMDTILKKHLNIPLSCTEETIILRTFLLERILFIKSKTKKDGSLKKGFDNLNSLPFSSIYEAMGIPKRDKKEKARKRKQYIIQRTKQIFDYWQNETGLLASWKELSDEDGVKSFRIFIDIENLN